MNHWKPKHQLSGPTQPLQSHVELPVGRGPNLFLLCLPQISRLDLNVNIQLRRDGTPRQPCPAAATEDTSLSSKRPRSDSAGPAHPSFYKSVTAATLCLPHHPAKISLDFLLNNLRPFSLKESILTTPKSFTVPSKSFQIKVNSYGCITFPPFTSFLLPQTFCQ